MRAAWTIVLLGAACPATARWVQDRFAISIWVDPIVPPREFDARYAELAAANFTVLLGGFGAKNRSSVSAQLGACAKHGLKAIVDTCGGKDAPPGRCVDDGAISKSPALWGYLLKDEPKASEFEGLANWSREVGRAAPDALRFINLLPNYASPTRQLQAPSYGAYVDEFVRAASPDLLCTDHYPHFEESSAVANNTLEGYHRNLGVLRNASIRAAVPFWNFFNAMPFQSYTAPTRGMIAWQAFTSLAYGAKGVLYFTYWSPTYRVHPDAAHRSLRALEPAADAAPDAARDAATPGSPPRWNGDFGKGGGLIQPVAYGVGGAATTVWERSAAYAHASAVNAVLLNFGNFLFTAASVGVWRTSGALPAGCPLSSLTETDAAGRAGRCEVGAGKYLVGAFELTDGRTAVLVVNQRHDVALWPTVAFALPGGALGGLAEVDEASGRERPVRDDSAALPGLQLALEPGMARLLVLPR